MSTPSATVLPAPLPVTRIRPGARDMTFSLREVWHARELLYFLVLRDIKIRYSQTVLGIAWSVIQPFTTMIVFTIFFGRLAKMPSDGLPYPLFSLAAVVPWTYFATAAANGAASLISNQHVLDKVYFPRLLIPLSAILTPVVDLAISFAMLLVLMLWYHVAPSASMLLLPLYVLLAMLAAFAVTLWTSALTVRYRDVKYVLPFAIQLWLFATPVVYPASVVPARLRAAYALNPMTVVVEGFRSALLGTHGPGATAAVGVVVVALGLVAGALYFRSVEGSIADLA